MFDLILGLIGTVMSLFLAIAMIYLYVKVFNESKERDVQIAEMKSKIGQIIRDINNINRFEYENDVQQQTMIDNLSQKVLNDKIKTEKFSPNR